MGAISLADDYPPAWKPRPVRTHEMETLGLKLSWHVWMKKGRETFMTPIYWHCDDFELVPNVLTYWIAQAKQQTLFTHILGRAAHVWLFWVLPFLARRPWLKRPYRYIKQWRPV
jgi:hypothetical protein